MAERIYMQEDNTAKWIVGGIVFVVLVIIAWVITNMAVMPQYRIYKQNKQGEANLRQQEWEKKILIEQAKAENESATLKAEARIKQAQADGEAEVIRAKGAAEAQNIISSTLNENYLRYLWIQGLHDGNGEVMYVPTEGGLPLFKPVN